MFEFLKPKPYRPWLRCPRTTQEKRMWEACEVKGRARRSPPNLPNAYDDIFIHYEKCWKSLRKTKWKRIRRG